MARGVSADAGEKESDDVNGKKLVPRLRRGDTAALGEVIEIYTPYVYAIVSNILNGALPEEDAEEIVSDTFTMLWYKRLNVNEDTLRGYIAAIARNKAKSRLRASRAVEPLDDDIPLTDCKLPEEQYIVDEMSAAAREAVDSLPEPDREIFQRHYFLYQRTEEIARDMDINATTVRTKLARGRKRLRAYLTERGYSCESMYN